LPRSFFFLSLICSYKLFDRLTWLLIRDKVNLWREKQLGLQSTTLAELRLSEVPFLYNFSPSVLPKPSDWGDHVHVTGYWFIKKKKEANVPEGLKEAIDKAKARGMKIAYIGFGSVSSLISPNCSISKPQAGNDKGGIRLILFFVVVVVLDHCSGPSKNDGCCDWSGRRVEGIYNYIRRMDGWGVRGLQERRKGKHSTGCNKTNNSSK
jgi:hypothetical protein